MKLKYLFICIILAPILYVFFTIAYIAINHLVIYEYWPDTKLNKDYLIWRKYGGDYKENFYSQLNLDRNRRKLIEGLNESEILKKIPNLTSGDLFKEGTYKNQFSSKYYKTPAKTKVYWLNEKDGFDWCVIITEKNIEFNLIKG